MLALDELVRKRLARQRQKLRLETVDDVVVQAPLFLGAEVGELNAHAIAKRAVDFVRLRVPNDIAVSREHFGTARNVDEVKKDIGADVEAGIAQEEDSLAQDGLFPQPVARYSASEIRQAVSNCSRLRVRTDLEIVVMRDDEVHFRARGERQLW